MVRGKGLAQAHAVGQDATAVGFELVDDAGGRIALEVEELLPDQRVLVAGAVVGQDILIHVAQELVEDVVEDQEVDALGRVFFVDSSDVVDDGCGHVLDLLGVVPDLVEQLEIRRRERRLVHLVDEVRDCVPRLVAEIHRGETVQGHVDGARIFGGARVDTGEWLHWRLRAVGHEARLAAQPFGALAHDGALGELVAQVDLELTAVQAALPVELGDVEFLALLADLVRHLFGHEGGRREDEAQLIDLLQLFLQGLEGIHRKA